MYVDKDSNDRYAIMDLDKEQFETIRRALTAYRVGLVHKGLPAGYSGSYETHEQYNRAGAIVRQVEKAL